MRIGNRLRVLAMAAGVAASLVAFGARPAQAASGGDNAAWAKVYGMQEGISPVTCGISAGDLNSPDHWSCSTSSALIANGADCTQAVYVNTTTVGPPVPGCTAELSNVSWGGDAVCASGGACHADGALGSATFTFQPVSGSPVSSQPATITDASCTADGGTATVASEGGGSGGTSYAMNGHITWVGSCTDTSLLTWTGTVAVV